MELLRRNNSRALCTHAWGKRGFSLAEMLVVIGVIALLLAIIISPLQMARRQAMATRCAAQQKDIGIALVSAKNDYSCYPLWDDGGSPQRYTWMDVLVELALITNVKVAYCPEDPQPSALNSARARHYNVLYPGRENRYGIDYSYGIGMPLSAGGQNWHAGLGPPGDNRPAVSRTVIVTRPSVCSPRMPTGA